MYFYSDYDIPIEVHVPLYGRTCIQIKGVLTSVKNCNQFPQMPAKIWPFIPDFNDSVILLKFHSGLAIAKRRSTVKMVAFKFAEILLHPKKVNIAIQL